MHHSSRYLTVPVWLFIAAQSHATGAWTVVGGIREGCNGAVNASAPLDDGRIIVGGSFGICADRPASNIALFDPASGEWSALGEGELAGVDGEVSAIVVDGSTVFVGGSFRKADALPAFGIARFDLTSGQWSALSTSPSPGVGGFVLALAIDDDRLLVGGQFSSAGGIATQNLAAFRILDGNWTTLGPSAAGANGPVRSIHVDAEDIYVGGSFSSVAGQPASNVALLDGVSGSWVALGAGTNGSVWDFARTGEDLYLVGSFTTAGNQGASRIARFRPSTREWVPMNPGLGGAAAALLADGSDLYVGGFFSSAGGIPAQRLARYDTLNESWSAVLPQADAPTGSVQTLDLIDSQLYVGGRFLHPSTNLLVLQPDTQQWAGIGSGPADGIAGAVHALLWDGPDLIVGGSFLRAGPLATENIVRYLSATRRWERISQQTLGGSVHALARLDGELYVGGEFTWAGETQVNSITRLDPVSEEWRPLGGAVTAGVTGTVLALAALGDHLYVAGSFASAGGQPAISIARYHPLTDSWSPLNGLGGAISSGNVYALASDGTFLYAGGGFGQMGASEPVWIARYDPVQDRWESLGTGPEAQLSSAVEALVLSDQFLYAAGGFVTAGGVPVPGMARFHLSQGQWDALSIPENTVSAGSVHALAAVGSDLYVGGRFRQSFGAAADHVARYDTISQSWHSLGQSSAQGTNQTVRVLLAAADSVVLGGDFGAAGGKPSAGLALWAIEEGQSVLFLDSFE